MSTDFLKILSKIFLNAEKVNIWPITNFVFRQSKAKQDKFLS